MYDVVIIGAGIIGGMIARALSRYDLKICVLEKENDVAMGSTKANSAIVHAGFDAPVGSLKAKLNVQGSQMMESVCKELGVKYIRNGSLVVGFNDTDLKTILDLYNRGKKNGVNGLKILNSEELHELEPALSRSALFALYAPTGAIVCPYGLAVAAIGNAMDNGAELKCNYNVRSITKTDLGFEVSSYTEKVSTKYIINCAGLFADEVSALANDSSFTIRPRKGEYILLDKECGKTVTHTIFGPPSSMGKGILVSPTVDGNLLLGPTSVDSDEKNNKDTTQIGLSSVLTKAREYLATVPTGKNITSFCGLRAVGSTGDFIIESPQKGFINVAGIESPGLSASPAIAEYVVDMLKDSGIVMHKKKKYISTRPSATRFRDASLEEKNKMISDNPAYGKIVCRCEKITEGEILDALRTNPKATDLDGIKRRTRAQMGRCQGGFCTPYIIELIARENGISFESVTKFGANSAVITGKTKGNPNL